MVSQPLISWEENNDELTVTSTSADNDKCSSSNVVNNFGSKHTWFKDNFCSPPYIHPLSKIKHKPDSDASDSKEITTKIRGLLFDSSKLENLSSIDPHSQQLPVSQEACITSTPKDTKFLKAPNLMCNNDSWSDESFLITATQCERELGIDFFNEKKPISTPVIEQKDMNLFKSPSMQSKLDMPHLSGKRLFSSPQRIINISKPPLKCSKFDRDFSDDCSIPDEVFLNIDVANLSKSADNLSSEDSDTIALDNRSSHKSKVKSGFSRSKSEGFVNQKHDNSSDCFSDDDNFWSKDANLQALFEFEEKYFSQQT